MARPVLQVEGHFLVIQKSMEWQPADIAAATERLKHRRLPLAAT